MNPTSAARGSIHSAYYSRYRLVRYRIRREIGYNDICLYVCVSVENRLEREIAYSADFFHSQVPRTKRYPVYFALSYLLHHGELCMGMGFGGCRIISKRRVASYACHASRIIFIRQKIVDGWMAVFCLSVFLCPFSHLQFSILSSLCWMVGGCMNACLRSLVGCHQQLLSREWNGGRVISAQHGHPFFGTLCFCRSQEFQKCVRYLSEICQKTVSYKKLSEKCLKCVL